MHPNRTGSNRIERKVPEYSSFDLATGLHGHHRCGAKESAHAAAGKFPTCQVRAA
jgi:hypothetical protein